MSKVNIDKDGIDDLFVDACAVRLERMDKGFYWIGLTLPSGETIHIDIVGASCAHSKVSALLRDGAAAFEKMIVQAPAKGSA